MKDIQYLGQLVELYRNAGESQMALFLGSGANGGSWAREHPACAGRPKLSRALFNHFQTEPRLVPDFEARGMRRNPKVGRVLTTNYGFFFSAAWPRYTSMRQSWRPMTRASKGTRPKGAGPVGA